MRLPSLLFVLFILITSCSNKDDSPNIIETSDRLYSVYNTGDYEGLVEIDVNTGNTIGEEYQLFGDGDRKENSFFDNSTNTFYYHYGFQTCGDCYEAHAAFFNLETKERNRLPLWNVFFGVLSEVQKYSTTLSGNSFYFTEYRTDNAQGTPSFKLRAMDIETKELRDVYEFSETYKWRLENSTFINATNSIFSFAKDENDEDVLFKFDLTINDFSVLTAPEAFQNLTYSIKDNKLFGTREVSETSYDIVEINSTSGSQETIINTIPYRTIDLDFSEDSNRFYALVSEVINSEQQYFTYIYNLDTNNSSILELTNGEKATGIFLDY